MSGPRLTSGLWVAAYRLYLSQAHLSYYITARGDETAGDILVKIMLSGDQAELFERGYDFANDCQQWRRICQDSEAEVDAHIMRQRHRDSDLWVIEVEDHTGQAAALLSDLPLG